MIDLNEKSKEGLFIVGIPVKCCRQYRKLKKKNPNESSGVVFVCSEWASKAQIASIFYCKSDAGCIAPQLLEDVRLIPCIQPVGLFSSLLQNVKRIYGVMAGCYVQKVCYTDVRAYACTGIPSEKYSKIRHLFDGLPLRKVKCPAL
jgi:hypothetical protein